MKSIFATIAALAAVATVSAQNIVSITSPLVGTTFTAGQPATISWINPTVQTISKIALAKGDPSALQVVSTIAENVAASTGSYIWNIPADIAPGTDYALELGTSPAMSFAGLFTIQAANGAANNNNNTASGTSSAATGSPTTAVSATNSLATSSTALTNATTTAVANTTTVVTTTQISSTTTTRLATTSATTPISSSTTASSSPTQSATRPSTTPSNSGAKLGAHIAAVACAGIAAVALISKISIGLQPPFPRQNQVK
ncbi:hypothetical protein DFQ29_004040 [Apophysomyces sp. BC1021]|nr:hypothetical protein DFQ29_004040 [Apophysomyces sp. BC1021]